MTDTDLGSELLQGYFGDADRLLAEQVAEAAGIDTALRLGAGFPEGPFAARGIPTGDTGAAVGNDAQWTSVAVLGSGQMACGITEAVVRSGFSVTLTARSEASADRAQRTIAGSLERAVARGRLDQVSADRALSRVDLRANGTVGAGVDLVIEAVAEDLAIKQETFRRLDESLAKDTVLATNTSSFQVREVASAVAFGRTTMALHFFNPAPAMKLVEVVRGTGTEGHVAAAEAWVRGVGKTPVRSADRRGFIVNRLLIPYLNDAVRLHERSGVPIEHIDAVMTGERSLPMGPFALIDMIGVDVTVAALESLAQADPDPRLQPADTLYRYLAERRLGRKSGAGFYQKGNGHGH